ncbi:MAG: PhnD/SsuA/transferrin family substrate-binding protein [Ruminococcus sp.]|nr:PhnD/SsuA/transferrin family substrate-binding protein [Ruminococcus sp.]
MMRMMAIAAAAAVSAGALVGCGASESTNSSSSAENSTADSAKGNNYADTITLVWYPNESAENFDGPREEVGRLIEQATGKKVEQKLTTDYAIAIESVSNGSAQIGCMFGGEGYIQAKNADDAVELLFVNSDSAGTLDGAMYYSFFAVNEEDAAEYASGDSYSIDNIQGKKMSFVSNSSTSGFKVPTNNIVAHFAKDAAWSNLTVDDLLEGGSDAFFSEVLFGGSHQGSAFNLISGKADVAAFCDTEIAPYASCTSGEENQVGSVYTINEGAAAPFNTVTGETFTIISSTPVMNGPFVYNSDTLSPEDVEAIQTLFTSDEVANNELIFYPEDSETKGAYKKTDNERFVLVEDSWYDPIRNME